MLVVSVEQDEFTLVVGLQEGENWVVLQRSLEVDDQDRELGLDRIHFSSSKDPDGGYFDVRSVAQKEGLFRIVLIQDGRLEAIDAGLSDDGPSLDQVQEAIAFLTRPTS